MQARAFSESLHRWLLNVAENDLILVTGIGKNEIRDTVAVKIAGRHRVGRRVQSGQCRQDIAIAFCDGHDVSTADPENDVVLTVDIELGNRHRRCRRAR